MGVNEMAYRVSHHVPSYTSEQLFDMVLDVERYPGFVPGWEAVRVRDRQETSYRTDQIVRTPLLRQRLQSLTTFQRPHQIVVTGKGGSLKRFDLEWRFAPLADGVRVDLTIDLETGFRPFQRVAETLTQEASRALLEAFVAEAERRCRSMSPALPIRSPAKKLVEGMRHVNP